MERVRTPNILLQFFLRILWKYFLWRVHHLNIDRTIDHNNRKWFKLRKKTRVQYFMLSAAHVRYRTRGMRTRSCRRQLTDGAARLSHN